MDLLDKCTPTEKLSSQILREMKYTPTEKLLFQILREMEKSNKLKERELRQQLLFIELFEECLPIADGKKRDCHERVARSSLND